MTYAKEIKCCYISNLQPKKQELRREIPLVNILLPVCSGNVMQITIFLKQCYHVSHAGCVLVIFKGGGMRESGYTQVQNNT